MSDKALQTVAEHVLNRAQEHGFVVPRDIRADLSQAGLADSRWKEVLALVQSRLRYRHGRYYYVRPVLARMQHRAEREHHQQLAVQQAVRRLIEQWRAEPTFPNRRRFRRIALGCTVYVLTADHRELQVLCSDISLGGVRLVGTTNLEDQTVCVRFPKSDGEGLGEAFRVCVLWGRAAGDGLFQNGGVFLELATETDLLRVIGAD